MKNEIFKMTQEELMEKILKEGNKFPITSSKDNLMNKKIDYKVLMLMTLLSNRQMEEDFIESGIEETWRYLYRNKLVEYQGLVEGLSKTKLDTIIRTINKISKLDCNVVNVRKTETGNIVYDINYANNSREYVTIDTVIMKSLISVFNSNSIKVYILLKYMCVKGEKQISREWILKQIGLSTKANKNYQAITDITDALACYGLINKRTITSESKNRITYYSINSVKKWQEIKKRNINSGKHK